MAYCSQTDIEREVLSPELVVQLSDDDGDGQADAAVVEQLIGAASAVVDSYCGGRYSTPFEPVPSIIRSSAATIAGYRLLARKGFDPEADKPLVEAYKAAMAWLRDVGAGKAHVPVTGAAPEPAQQPTRLVARTQQFDEETLERY